MKPRRLRKCLTNPQRRQPKFESLEDRRMLALPGDMKVGVEVDVDDVDA